MCAFRKGNNSPGNCGRSSPFHALSTSGWSHSRRGGLGSKARWSSGRQREEVRTRVAALTSETSIRRRNIYRVAERKQHDSNIYMPALWSIQTIHFTSVAFRWAPNDGCRPQSTSLHMSSTDAARAIWKYSNNWSDLYLTFKWYSVKQNTISCVYSFRMSCWMLFTHTGPILN